jgi:citronellol/citronellal dehydrogenase
MTRSGGGTSDPLAGRTVFISGGSRGIGLEIGRSLARAGAQIALIAKTEKPSPVLPDAGQVEATRNTSEATASRRNATGGAMSQ